MKSSFNKITDKIKNLSKKELLIGGSIIGLFVLIFIFKVNIFSKIKALYSKEDFQNNNNFPDPNNSPELDSIENSLNNLNKLSKELTTQNKSNSNSNKIVVTYYSFDFCGHCKKFTPIWEKTKNKFKNNKNIQFREYIANKLSSEEKRIIPNFINCKYAPVVILTKNNKNVELNRQSKDPEFQGLDKFIESEGTINVKENSPHV